MNGDACISKTFRLDSLLVCEECGLELSKSDYVCPRCFSRKSSNATVKSANNMLCSVCSSKLAGPKDYCINCNRYFSIEGDAKSKVSRNSSVSFNDSNVCRKDDDSNDFLHFYLAIVISILFAGFMFGIWWSFLFAAFLSLIAFLKEG